MENTSRENEVRLDVKRDFKQAADYLTSKTLLFGISCVQEGGERQHLERVSNIQEKLMKSAETCPVASHSGLVAIHDEENCSDVPGCLSALDAMAAPLPYAAKFQVAVTRGSARGRPLIVSRLASYESRQVADLFALDAHGVLYRLAPPTRDRSRDAQDELRLVIPTTLREDILHYAHEDFQSGHQGTNELTKSCVLNSTDPGCMLTWSVMSWSVLTARVSERRNTFLLLLQDMFSGLCKPMSSTTAENVAEVYEERVFKMFGASKMICHDQDPRFMRNFKVAVKVHSELPTSGNGQQERSVQTVIRSARAYVTEADQSDWDDHAERLMFALNTSFDATRLDTPFYFVHGWHVQGTVSSMLGPKPSSLPEWTAYEPRRTFQLDYSYARACAKGLQKKEKRMRLEAQTQKCRELSERLKSGFERCDAVWLYIPKVQPGLSRKLAHSLHGPFRIDEVHDAFWVKLKIDGTGYRVHVSRLEPRALFPKRPVDEVILDDNDDLDVELLPEDSWEADNQNNEYEVERILDLRWTKSTQGLASILSSGKGMSILNGYHCHNSTVEPCCTSSTMEPGPERVSGRCMRVMTILRSSWVHSSILDGQLNLTQTDEFT
ncbi:reverse transcriptase [Phytophthora megakarya]|uniref:Reverse transcriptase n=1 Tax=Phytophthora megakarya TaxID=4795 RepID=A0A225WYT1_9STRA|nr:reverse transcriptase [Phytophthora megakarya]